MRFAKVVILFVAVAALLPAAVPARAGVDIDFGAAVPIGDDGQLFVNVSSRQFGVPVRTVEHVATRLRDPDDVAVALFLSARSGRSPDAVLDLRVSTGSWFDVGVRIGVPYDAWFVPVKVVPSGPPYGNAYGHWKKHGKASTYRLSDREARDLVAVRVMHEYYGLPADEAMRRRASDGDVRSLVTKEYRGRHGKDKAKGSGGNGSGNGNGNGNGKEKSGGENPSSGKGNGKKNK